MNTSAPKGTSLLSPALAFSLFSAALFAGCAAVPAAITEGQDGARIAIASVSDLTRFRDAWNRGDFRKAAAAPSLVLERDLDLGTIERWQPIGTRRDPFDGVLDGKGHAISGRLSCAIGAGAFELDCGLFGDVQASPRNLSGPVVRNASIAIGISATGERDRAAPIAAKATAVRPKIEVRLGALAGHANRLRLRGVHLTEEASVHFDATAALPHSHIALLAGGLIGHAERIEATSVSTAGRVDVASPSVSAGGLFGKLGCASVQGARLNGALKASGRANLSAGGLAGDVFNEVRRGSTPVLIADIASSMALDLWGDGNASVGGLAGHLVATKSDVERVRIAGRLWLTIGADPDGMGRAAGLGQSNFTIGGIAGTMAMADLRDAEVTAHIAIDTAGAIRQRPITVGGIAGQASLMSLQNLAFSGAIEVSDVGDRMPPNVGGIAGYVSGVTRIANALVQGELPVLPRRAAKGLVGLSDQRGHFLFCDRWPEPLGAVGAVSRPARVHASSQPFGAMTPLEAEEIAEHFNAPLHVQGRPQRCLTPGNYLPWKVDAEGRAALDFSAKPLAAREFIGSAVREPRDLHWKRRIELANWETAEVQKRFERMTEGEPPFPLRRDRRDCAPLAHAKLGLPEGSPCLFSEGEHGLTQCDGVRGARRLRHLRFVFARERLEEFVTRRMSTHIDQPMGEFLDGDYRRSLQGLAMTAHAFALTPSVGVESWLREGQHAFGGERHLTLLAMERAKLDGLAERTQIFEQLRHPARRGAPDLPNEMRDAPKWVYWNCFDALNPELAGKGAGQEGASRVGQRARRFPFCGVGRSGDDVALPHGVSRGAFAAQEALDALAEAVESWLNMRLDVRDRIRAEGRAVGGEGQRAARERLRALPFANFELGCGVSDLIVTGAAKLLHTERWTSADGEVWALAAIDEGAFLDLLARDESLAEDAADLAEQELAASFAEDAAKRRRFAEITAPRPSQTEPSCEDLARKYLGWQGEFHCAMMSVVIAPQKARASESGRSDRYAPLLRNQLASNIARELIHPVAEERAAWMKASQSPNAPLALADLSAVNALTARMRAPKFGISSPQSTAAQPSPFLSLALHFAGLDRAELDKSLARVSFVEQLRDPALRGKAPTAPEMSGAPTWVRWTCFDALKGEATSLDGAKPPKRHPYCSVAADKPAQMTQRAIGAAQRAADDRLVEQVAVSVALQLQKYLRATMTSDAGGQTSDRYGAMRDDEWQRVIAEDGARERRWREEMDKVQAAQAALAQKVRGLRFLHRTWTSRDGEIWAMSALDEASLLRTIRQTKGMGADFADWLKRKLDAEYRPPIGGVK